MSAWSASSAGAAPTRAQPPAPPNTAFDRATLPTSRSICRYYFAWGSGEAGWQNFPDNDFTLSPDAWNHVVISADHRSKPPTISVWLDGQLQGQMDYQERATQW